MGYPAMSGILRGKCFQFKIPSWLYDAVWHGRSLGPLVKTRAFGMTPVET